MVTAVTANPSFFFGFRFGRAKRDAQHVEPTPQQRLERLRFEIKGILGLFALATSKRELNSLLDAARDDLTQRFLDLVQAAHEVNPAEIEALASGENETFKMADMPVPDLIAAELSSRTLEKLHSTRESFDAFGDWIGEHLAQGTKGLPEFLLRSQQIEQAASNAPLDASYLIEALMLVLDGQIERWTTKSLTLLIDTLDQRMTVLEDAFFGIQSRVEDDENEVMTEDEFRASIFN